MGRLWLLRPVLFDCNYYIVYKFFVTMKTISVKTTMITESKPKAIALPILMLR